MHTAGRPEDKLHCSGTECSLLLMTHAADAQLACSDWLCVWHREQLFQPCSAYMLETLVVACTATDILVIGSSQEEVASCFMWS